MWGLNELPKRFSEPDKNKNMALDDEEVTKAKDAIRAACSGQPQLVQINIAHRKGGCCG